MAPSQAHKLYSMKWWNKWMLSWNCNGSGRGHKDHKSLQPNRRPDLNPEPPEHEGVLTPRPRR